MTGNAFHISLLSPAVGTGNIGDHFIELAIRRLLDPQIVYHRFSIRRPLKSDEIEQINQTKCALICGTNLYQHDWESALTPAILDLIAVPVIPFGVGSSAAELRDTFVGDVTRSMIRAIHRRCAIGSVRDPHAQQVVARAGVENVAMTGCPVLFWAANGELPQVQQRPRKKLVLTARNWLMHRWPDNVDHPLQIELLRRVVLHFSKQPMLFAVHEEFDRSLVRKLGIASDGVLDANDPQDYLRLYSDPDNVVLAMRLHAGMLARANGLPAIFVGHDTRTYAFCEMAGIECIDLFAEDAIQRTIETLTAALRGGPPARDQACQRFASLRDAMDRFLETNHLPARREVYSS